MQVRGWIARDADVLDFFDTNAGSSQAVANGFRGEARTVLDAIKAFLFNRGEQFTVFDDRRGRVTVICVYAEYVHSLNFGFRSSDFGLGENN